MTIAEMTFCYVPAGPFMMGSTEYNDEQPEHELDLPYGYWIGQSPITVAQYAAFIEAGDMETGIGERSRLGVERR